MLPSRTSLATVLGVAYVLFVARNFSGRAIARLAELVKHFHAGLRTLYNFASSRYRLKSPCFCLRSQAETWHVLHVLTLGDEFREGVVFLQDP